MADDNSDQEKTEDPTPRRLDQAREEGQVPRSRELTTFMLLLGGVGGITIMGPYLYDRLGLVMEQAFLFERQQALKDMAMLRHAWDLALRTLAVLVPLYLALLVIALVSPMLLGGWSMSAKSLQPKPEKLNPIKGLARVFSSQALAELGKGVAKSALVGGIVVAFLTLKHGEFMALMEQPVKQALTNALSLAALACGLMVLGLVVVILIDIPYQLWSHHKKLRMSKDEVKREHKETEGDPQVRARIRSQQQSMARRRMMSEVPDADVVVTNPSHYAVALRYDESRMSAPRVVAKGADAVAARIREIAGEHRVPLLEAPPLARALYRHVDLEREVPAALYTAVAEVLAWAFRLRRARDAGESAPEPPAALPVPASLADSASGHLPEGAA